MNKLNVSGRYEFIRAMSIHPLLLCFGLIVMPAKLLLGQPFQNYRQLTDTVIYSPSLGYDKKISITVPSEYGDNLNNQNFPLIVVFDSQNQRSYRYILNTIDYLTGNEQMPASVILGVESTMESRYGETQLEVSDQAAFGSNNESFIFDELIPFARSNFSAGNFTLLMGHSRYGYFTSYLLTKRYDELNAVIAASPVFRQKNANLAGPVADLITGYNGSKTLYFRFGIGNDYPEEYYRINQVLENHSHAGSLIDIKGYLYPEADHNVTPGLISGTALYDIFAYWSRQQNIFMDNENRSFDTLPGLKRDILEHYGAELRFAPGVLNGKGWFFFSEGDFKNAIRAWEITLNYYPGFSEIFLNIANAQKELAEDFSGSLQQLRESLKTTRFYSDTELLELLHAADEMEKSVNSTSPKPEQHRSDSGN